MLGVMMPGMGSVATTMIAGVEAVRRGMAKPVGSMAEMGTLELDGRFALIRDAVPLAALDDIVFTGWDIFGGNLFDAAKTAGVLDRDQLELMRPFLEGIEPMPAAFDARYVKRLTPKSMKRGKNKCDLCQPTAQ